MEKYYGSIATRHSPILRVGLWKDVRLFRADENDHYANIDSLFSGTVDWDLIETHWRDLMQVILSIQAGTIPLHFAPSSLILQSKE